MENKVLVKLVFPELDKSFDIYLPVNEILWKIKKLVLKSISDLCDIKLISNDYLLINKNTGYIYGNNEIVLQSDIRNGTELILVSN